MSKIVDKFRSSARELMSVESLAICSMLLGLHLVLGLFTLQVGNYLKIGFSYLANQLAYLLFGPFVGIFFGGAGDVLSFLLKPTGAYFFGFTLSAMLGGLIYGLILYKRPVRFWRVLLAQSLVAVFINILLGTFWLSLLYGKGFVAILPARVIKNLVQLPINSLSFYALAKVLEEAKVIRFVRKRSRYKKKL